MSGYKILENNNTEQIKADIEIMLKDYSGGVSLASDIKIEFKTDIDIPINIIFDLQTNDDFIFDTGNKKETFVCDGILLF